MGWVIMTVGNSSAASIRIIAVNYFILPASMITELV
jgi:hypothetical protein